VNPDVQAFVYAEELEGTDPDLLARQLVELGLDAVSMAVVYHRARRVFPRQRRLGILTETTVYFAPQPARYGKLLPRRVAAAELRRRIWEFRRACAEHGLAFRAWIVALHHERLADDHPALAARGVDGSPNGIGLCPSSREAVEFVSALIADVCAQLEPDGVELEAALYPAWEPSYTLTLALEPVPEVARLFGTQCFCASCRALIGVDADEIERRTAEAAGPPFGTGGWDADLLAELAELRSCGARRVVESAAEAAHAAGATLRIFGSGTPEQASLQGFSGSAVAAADRILLGCGPLSGEALQVRFEGLRKLVGDRRVAASTNWTSERTAASLAVDVDGLAAAGADGLALYNFTLVPEEGVAAFRTAAAAFRRRATVPG
jgi:hypothetical protein